MIGGVAYKTFVRNKKPQIANPIRRILDERFGWQLLLPEYDSGIDTNRS